METRDELYPVGDDQYRVCAWYDDQWASGAGMTFRPFKRHLECGARFRVWNRQANREAWAYCPRHAEDDRAKKPKKG